jgi:ubiquinone/menaquinone biosynthesis C-methylase UbiE
MINKFTPEWQKVFDEYAMRVIKYCKENAEVLDLGCGGGWSCISLKKLRKDLKVTGAVLSTRAFEEGAGKIANDIIFTQQDAMSLTFADCSFDVVTSYALMEHIPDANKALSEMLRVLRPGGYLIVCGPNMLSPLRGLKLFFKGLLACKFHPDGKPKAILNNFKLLIMKIFSSELTFHYREPILNNQTFLGSDWDAVYLLNPIDLIQFARKNNMEVLNTSSSSSFLGRIILRIIPYFAGGVYFVARKQG